MYGTHSRFISTACWRPPRARSGRCNCGRRRARRSRRREVEGETKHWTEAKPDEDCRRTPSLTPKGDVELLTAQCGKSKTRLGECGRAWRQSRRFPVYRHGGFCAFASGLLFRSRTIVLMLLSVGQDQICLNVSCITLAYVKHVAESLDMHIPEADPEIADRLRYF